MKRKSVFKTKALKKRKAFINLINELDKPYIEPRAD